MGASHSTPGILLFQTPDGTLVPLSDSLQRQYEKGELAPAIEKGLIITPDATASILTNSGTHAGLNLTGAPIDFHDKPGVQEHHKNLAFYDEKKELANIVPEEATTNLKSFHDIPKDDKPFFRYLLENYKDKLKSDGIIRGLARTYKHHPDPFIKKSALFNLKQHLFLECGDRNTILWT